MTQRTSQQNRATKYCRLCNCEIVLNKKYSKTQWENTKYCSRKCYVLSKVGTHHSPETRLKLSLLNKKIERPFFGKYKRTEVHKKASRERLKKLYKERGDEIGKKLSIALTGKKMSQETLLKMRLIQQSLPTYRGGEATRLKRRAFAERQRNFRKYNNGGSHTLEQWENLKQLYNFACPCCLITEPVVKLTEDHILPLIKGGTNDISNIQPLCQSCNSRKMTKTIKYETHFATK